MITRQFFIEKAYIAIRKQSILEFVYAERTFVGWARFKSEFDNPTPEKKYTRSQKIYETEDIREGYLFNYDTRNNLDDLIIISINVENITEVTGFTYHLRSYLRKHGFTFNKETKSWLRPPQ